jgi:hypothetical protein
VFAVVVCVLGQALPIGAAGAGGQQPPTKEAPSIAGKWVGKVVADRGEMPIAVTLTVKEGVASGSIETAHGAMTIAKGTLKDGKWTLPFTAESGTGRMIAVLKGDVLAGDWDFAPNAVGTFELTRQK